MVINKGEKIHVVTRRLFVDDLRRHFVGEVIEASDVAVRAVGYVFVFNAGISQYIKREQLRTRIISIVNQGNVINVIPKELELEKLTYQFTSENKLVMADDKGYQLDINEFGASM